MIDFPTRTMEALIQQNKTLSSKVATFSYHCKNKEKQIQQLKAQYQSLSGANRDKEEKLQNLQKAYQSLQISYQGLQNSHQQFKDNLADTEKQFALEYTHFLEKKQAWRDQILKLQAYTLRLAKYREHIHQRVRPYIQKIKQESIQGNKELLYQKEKIFLFQKQLKDAYKYIQRLSSELRDKEKAFQKATGQMQKQLTQKEAENQKAQEYLIKNQKLNQDILKLKNNFIKLEKALIASKESQSQSEKKHSMQVEKLKKQIQTLVSEKKEILGQLKVFSKELTKREKSQSQASTLVNKKLLDQLTSLQQAFQAHNLSLIQENSPSTKKKKSSAKKKKLSSSSSSKAHHIYQKILEAQTGFFK